MRQTNQLTFKTLRPASSQDEEANFLCQDVLGNSLKKTEENYVRVAGFFDGKMCATAMLIRQDNLFKMQNVAVTPEMQNKGVGSMLLKFCEELVWEKGVAAIYCHARDYAGRSAVNFFLKNEYFCRGGEFEEDGIANQLMIKLLALDGDDS